MRILGARCTADVVEDLRRGNRLVVCEDEVDPHLEMAEIQRRVFLRGGPAVFFPRVKGCRFPCVSNLFGSLDQSRYLFRHTLESVRRLIELKIDPNQLAKRPWRYWRVPFSAWNTLPKSVRRGPVMAESCEIRDLPAIQSWPDDGGPFVTLPQVLSADPTDPQSLMRINLGMYRVQLHGNQYVPDQEIGLHYQIHRGIGVHHRRAMDKGEPLRVAISVGGSPAMTVSAVMPLPEGLTELIFAGALAGHRIRMIKSPTAAPVYADADFVISGIVNPGETKPEGPFGDHLGYYSLQHPFPVLRVKRVWHRKNAVWPFTVVGRPPQEDTSFGELIHELTGPIIPTVIPGVREVHAVDAAGVHPLLLAIGSERYMPFQEVSTPAEILTQANAILGNGQLSLAKYLFILNGNDCPDVSTGDIGKFMQAILCRTDWKRDLHFQTNTTIDTLDYSGDGMNRGSKVVIAAAGPVQRELPTELSGIRLPEGFHSPTLVLPGVLAVQGPTWVPNGDGSPSAPRLGSLRYFCDQIEEGNPLTNFPLITICDDSDFTARNLSNWLWVCFTRSNPATDIDGYLATTRNKHWGCHKSLVIDARIKPHHAPPLVEDPRISQRVDSLASRGGALSRWL